MRIDNVTSYDYDELRELSEILCSADRVALIVLECSLTSVNDEAFKSESYAYVFERYEVVELDSYSIENFSYSDCKLLERVVFASKEEALTHQLQRWTEALNVNLAY